MFAASPIRQRTIAALGAALLPILSFGCATAPDASGSGHLDPAPQDEGLPVTTVVDARPAALVGGHGITWGDLRPSLSELAGGAALEEAILDRQIEAALARSHFDVTEAEIERERELLLGTLASDADHAQRLLERLRDRQGLGLTRFHALLWRNAALRMLVRAQVTIGPEAVERMHQIVHGPRRQARVMLLTTLREADEAIEELRSGELFAEIAARRSVDQSAARGGLLEPVSRADPRYPEALRQTLWTLQPAEVSPPVLIGSQYALVMLVDEIPADGVALEQVQGEMERLARLQQERLAMDRLSRALVNDLSIVIFDEALRESWERRLREQVGVNSQ